MTQYSFTFDVFQEPNSSQFLYQEASFLMIDEFFSIEPVGSPQMEGDTQLSKAEDPPLLMAGDTQLSKAEDPSASVAESVGRKPAYKSSLNKNACFNICQKVIKAIQKGTFDDKLAEFLSEFNLDCQEFKLGILSEKKNFTGPKALAQYVSRQTPQTRVFASFMKWFLTNKYLRIVLNEGEMKDKKAYIEYKNLVVLPLLE